MNAVGEGGESTTRESIRDLKRTMEEMRDERRSDAREAREAVQTIQIQLHGIVVDVALLKNHTGDMPQFRVRLDALETQAIAWKVERKTALAIWGAILAVVTALSTLGAYFLSRIWK